MRYNGNVNKSAENGGDMQRLMMPCSLTSYVMFIRLDECKGGCVASMRLIRRIDDENRG